MNKIIINSNQNRLQQWNDFCFVLLFFFFFVNLELFIIYGYKTLLSPKLWAQKYNATVTGVILLHNFSTRFYRKTIRSTASSCCRWKYRNNYPVYNILHNNEPYWKKTHSAPFPDMKKRPWRYYSICYFSGFPGRVMGWHHLRSGLQELWLLLNDNYHSSWGASIFYNLVVVSTFLCKGSRDSTYTHTGLEWGPHGPHWFNSIWQNPLGRAEGERKMEREREGERERHGERGVRETLQGPLLPTIAIKWKQELLVYPPKPPMHESGRKGH